MNEIRTAVEIDAPVATTWEVLTEFDAYPEWNPFATSISGEPRAGERLTIRLELPDQMGMTIKPTVLRAEPEREFRWRGRTVVPRIFDGEHIFELSATADGGTRLVHREEFRGVLVTPMLWWVGKNTLAGFQLMNEALKARVEARVAAAS